MSWAQEYHIERLIDFAWRLYNKNDFLDKVFEKILGLKIVKIEQIVLDDDCYNGKQMGCKITLSNGEVYIHKLLKRYMSGGNYGCDTYGLVKENEKVEVKEQNED